MVTSQSVKGCWGSCQHLLMTKPILVFFFFCPFLGPHLRHMEVPGLESELQLLAYGTATATLDPSHICSLHHSLRQCSVVAVVLFCLFLDK